MPWKQQQEHKKYWGWFVAAIHRRHTDFFFSHPSVKSLKVRFSLRLRLTVGFMLAGTHVWAPRHTNTMKPAASRCVEHPWFINSPRMFAETWSAQQHSSLPPLKMDLNPTAFEWRKKKLKKIEWEEPFFSFFFTSSWKPTDRQRQQRAVY